MSHGNKMAAEVPVITTIFKTRRHEGKVETPVTSVSKSKSNSSQSSSDFQLYVTGLKTITCQPLTISTWKAKVSI